MKKIKNLIKVLIITALIIIPLTINAEFMPNPQTNYAKEFITKSQEQQWFLEEIETYLNQEQKSINTLRTKEELNNITSLGLENKNITGIIPESIGDLTNLKYIYLANNNIKAPLPNSLYTLTNLENMDLSNNKLTGKIPEQLGQMTSLKTLNLKQNKYQGNIPQTIQNNQTITNLNLMENNLEGQLPIGLNNMTNLQYLNLSQNNLGGTIPNLENLTRLKALSLWNTNLKGEIHPSIYNLKQLQILDLAENALEGTLTENIGNLEQLQHLTIADNKIQGNIPTNIKKLKQLQTINLSNNLLRGEVPDIFTMAKLEEIDIKNNYLRGHLPQTIRTAHENKTTIYAQHNYLTGEVLKQIQNNQHNFLDEEENEQNEQYQLIAQQNPTKIYKNKEINIHQNLKNLNLITNNQIQKIKLNPDEYTIKDNNNPIKTQITITNQEINIKALEEIKQTDNYKIQIKIKANTNSNYSKTDITLTTEEIIPGGGGGGGGGALPIPPEQLPENIPQLQTNHKAYIKGYQEGNFKADNHITREETAAMLITAMDIKEEKVYASKYNDVEKTRWSINHIEEAQKRTYLIGYQGNYFKPENPITRAELASALVSISQKENLATQDENQTKTFKDVNQNAWYYNNVQTAIKLGLITGYQNNTFKPEQNVTRAEAVTMINQMLKRNPETLNLELINNPFNDVKTNHWAYRQILEAATTHTH